MELQFCSWKLVFFSVVAHNCICAKPRESVFTRNESTPANLIAWGLSDATVSAGIVFSYNISALLQLRKNIEFELSEHNRCELPSWLEFNKISNILTGIPSYDDIGKVFYIKVVYKDTINSSSILKDVFGIQIVNRKSHVQHVIGTEGDNLTILKCSSGLKILHAAIILSASFDSLSPSKKVDILKNVAAYLGLFIEEIKYVSGRNQSLIHHKILIADMGNIETPFVSNWFQWNVGCGNVIPRHLSIVEQLATAYKTGDLSRAAGYDIIGWCVTNKITMPAKTRLRRHAEVDFTAATPLNTTKPPKFNSGIATVTIKASKLAPKHAPLTPIYGLNEQSPFFKSKISMPVTIKPFDFENTKLFSNTSSSDFRNIENGNLEPSMTTDKTMITVSTARLDKKLSMHTESFLAKGPSRVASIISELEEKRDMSNNLAPTANFELGSLTVVVGQILIYAIPSDLFSDIIDGNTENLSLSLLHSNGDCNTVESWIYFNERTQTIYALPMRICRQRCFLSATNSLGKKSKLGFFIDAQKLPEYLNINYVMSISLNIDYREFMNNASFQLEIAQKISCALGDKDINKIIITSIEPGSVKYSWTNISLSSEVCATTEILTLASDLVFKNKTLNHNFIKSLEPFMITEAKIVPRKSCNFDIREVSLNIGLFPYTDTIINTGITISNRNGVAIQPVIIVLAIVLAVSVVTVVIICRSRCRTKRANSLKFDSSKRGVPVIFANELESKMELQDKPLLTVRE